MTSEPEPIGKTYSTLVAIVCVTLLAIVTVFAVAEFSFNGETLKVVVLAAILAVAGLGGYEIREQLKTS